RCFSCDERDLSKLIGPSGKFSRRISICSAIAVSCRVSARLHKSSPASRPGAPQGAAQGAPQLAHSLLSKPGERITTTLDAQLQRLATSTLRNHLSQLSNRNVRDGAVLIVDNDSGNVLAYVASASTTSRSKQVDGIRAHRQAGSTLKPFLYELALERHYITAASLLND